MKVSVIINPVAGTGGQPPHRTRDRVEQVHDLLHAYGAYGAHGIRAEVFVTERVGHAFELAAAAVDRGISSVLAWAGDGTVNEVGAALAFHEVSLGIVPVGSGNGLARELNIGRHPRHVSVVALEGRDRRIDAGELGVGCSSALQGSVLTPTSRTWSTPARDVGRSRTGPRPSGSCFPTRRTTTRLRRMKASSTRGRLW